MVLAGDGTEPPWGGIILRDRMGRCGAFLSDLSGGVGDWGTILPLVLGVSVVCGTSSSAAFFFLGAWFILSGLVYRMPVPVEPMKVVAVIAIASVLTPGAIMACGLILGFLFLILGFGPFMQWIADHVPVPVTRGVQLALALLLATTAIPFISGDLFSFTIAGAVILVFLVARTWRRVPDLSAIVVIGGAILAGLVLHGLPHVTLPPVSLPLLPSPAEWVLAAESVVIPQALLTLTNAILATSLLAGDLYDRQIRAPALSRSIGIMNLTSVPFGGFPLCHGAGGLAAQYRFGARTSRANIAGGVLLIGLSLFFADPAALSFLPMGIFGALLLAVAFELGRHSLSVSQRMVPVTLCIGIVSLAAGITAAFLAGLILWETGNRMDIWITGPGN